MFDISENWQALQSRSFALWICTDEDGLGFCFMYTVQYKDAKQTDNKTDRQSAGLSLMAYTKYGLKYGEY